MYMFTLTCSVKCERQHQKHTVVHARHAERYMQDPPPVSSGAKFSPQSDQFMKMGKQTKTLMQSEVIRHMDFICMQQQTGSAGE